jgi:hypothetical protein
MPGAAELYDLEKDPEERTNLAAKRPRVVKRLLANLVARDPWVTEPFPETAGDGSQASGALGALGYAGDDEDGAAAQGPEWRWTCLEHPDVREAKGGTCPNCGARLFPIGGAR